MAMCVAKKVAISKLESEIERLRKCLELARTLQDKQVICIICGALYNLTKERQWEQCWCDYESPAYDYN